MDKEARQPREFAPQSTRASRIATSSFGD